MNLLNHLGREFLDDPRLNQLHRTYVRVFGVPISGMRIRLRRILPLIEGDFSSIADLGCGKGIFTFELARKFPKARVVGIDLNADQIAINRSIAGKRAVKNVEFVTEDILKLRSVGEFDLVVSVDNLEHIADDVGALKRMREAMKPGATLVCHVPAYERTWVFLGRKTNFDVEGHVRPGYRPEELKKKLEQAGFRIVFLKCTYGYLETVSNNLSYLITGAAERNKAFYALAFPFLNLMSWLGRNQDPGESGAGVVAIAKSL